MNPDRQYAVASLLFDYVKSPALRHLRDPHSIHRLARDIVNTLDRASSVWKKWEPDREEIINAAGPCWIPADDLQAFLNTLPGPPLTKTDVEQRLRARNHIQAIQRMNSRRAVVRCITPRRSEVLRCVQSSVRSKST
jgi:hypothetical protein